jgi:hypothetical protein
MWWGHLKILFLRTMKPEKGEFYMKTFWHRTKASWLKSWAPEGWMGQMEMKCISYFYMGQGYSGEWCGPWASCLKSLHGSLIYALFKAMDFLLPLT